MAGYVNGHEFHIGAPEVDHHIRQAAQFSRVITMQLDGDELDAALWGIKNYKKGVHNVED